MRVLSLDYRRAMHAQECDEIPVVLVTITHADLSEPIRLSSDATERLSVDPITYGTVSNGDTFLYMLMSLNLPDDKEGEALAGSLQIEDVEADVGPLLAPILSGIKITIQVTTAASPDLVQIEYADLDVLSAQGAEGAITLSYGREDPSVWIIPGDAMTKDRFPGQF